MSIIDNLREGARKFLGIEDYEDKPRIDVIERNRNYRAGKQKKMLKVKGFDDNVTINISGLIVDRWVSWLFGHGVEFNLPGDDDSEQQVFIDAVWDANRKDILLHKVGVNGSEAGNAYVKIIPDGIAPGVARLIAIDPKFIKMETAQDDYETVVRYIISYGDVDDKVRTTEVSEIEDGKWHVYKITKVRGQQETREDLKWSYDFPPIAWCQNLPSIDSCYGVPDIDDNTRAMQDSVNFIASNINKIIRLHGHPQTWGNNISNLKTLEWGPDKMIDAGTTGQVHNLEMVSDLSASQNFLQFFIKQLYATTRTVDLDSLADKLGALTNFGLHVLFQDTLTKLETKRRLYGEMLVEINRRLLIIGNKGDDAGEIYWNDVVPESDVEESTALKADLEMGIVSKETVAMKRGYDYQVEQEKMAADKTNDSNIGAALLTAFNRNQNGEL